MQTRFGLTFDAQKEVICVIGSKEAIAHFPFAFVNPGDVVLCPDPGYPGVRDADPVRGRRALLPAAAPRQRLPHRPGRDPGRRRAAREDHVDQLPEQSDRRAGGARLLRDGGRVRAEVRRHRRQRSRLQRDVLRGAAAFVPGDAGRARGRHRVPLAVEDLQHDRLARRLGVRQRDAGGGPRPGEDQRRLGRVRGRAARGDRRAQRRPGAASRGSARSTASGATCCAAA